MLPVNHCSIISTDEDPGLRIESFAIIKLRGVTTKCEIYFFTMQTFKELMDHLHYRLNFDFNKSRQKFHHSLKEHHKISNIPKFRCEML